MRSFVQHALAILLTGISGFSQAQTRVAPEVPDTVQVEKGIEFARYGDRVLKLDLYRPIDTGAPIPVIVAADVAELEGAGGNGEFSSSVYAAVGFSSLTDLTELPGNTKGIVKDFLGGWDFLHRKKRRFASPITHVTANSVLDF